MATNHRAALEAAVGALPTADDETWSVPAAATKAAGLEDDEAAARSYVLKFSEWARDAIGRLPPVPRDEMQATDFNDYYKIVMSRVQFLWAQASGGSAAAESPVCQFATQLRRRPTFVKGGEVYTLGCFDVAGTQLGADKPALVGSLEASLPRLRQALEAVGARKFDAGTLGALLERRGPVAAGIEESLKPVNSEWISALEGRALFELLPDGADFTNGPHCEAKLLVQDGQVRTEPTRAEPMGIMCACAVVRACAACATRARLAERGDRPPRPRPAGGGARAGAVVPRHLLRDAAAPVPLAVHDRPDVRRG